MSKYRDILSNSEHPVRDIWAFIQGNYRFKLYYSKKPLIKRLMRPHIREQIEYRLIHINPACYYSGSCVICGCDIPNLQMASKQCEGREYPAMMSKKDWNKFKLDLNGSDSNSKLFPC